MKTITGKQVTSRIEAGNLNKFIGEDVQIRGWIYKIRKMSGFAFVILMTGKTQLQCVYSKEHSTFELDELCANMNVELTGQVLRDDRSKTGVEIRLKTYTSLSLVPPETPIVINNKEVVATLDKLLDYRPITLRNARERAIFQVQAGICRGFRKFFDENGFTEIRSPKIVFGGAEGGANIFKLDYFGREAYLAQSPQFYKQITVGVFERVYEIAPVFRAERHDTSRHINEYTSVDIEMGFIDSFYDIMALETKMLAETLEFLREWYAPELELLRADIPEITGIPAVSFREAKDMIVKAYGRETTDPEDFEPEEERLICEIMKKKTGSEFVFVTHYRAAKRPFYAMNSPDDPEFTESFDLLFRGVEITTGGQRIHDYFTQIAKMEKLGLKPESYNSYLMAHKFGLPPHGGFGLGLERFTARLLNIRNVRCATMFPRDTTRLEP